MNYGKPLKPGDLRHGTRGGYAYHRCRCRKCRDAWTEGRRGANYDKDACPECGRPKSKKAWRCKTCEMAGRSVEHPHGSELRYAQGCACAECREGARLSRRVRGITNDIGQQKQREADALAELARRHGA